MQTHKPRGLSSLPLSMSAGGKFPEMHTCREKRMQKTQGLFPSAHQASRWDLLFHLLLSFKCPTPTFCLCSRASDCQGPKLICIHHLYLKPPRPQGHSHPPGSAVSARSMVQPSRAEKTHTGIPKETIPPQVAPKDSYLSPIVSAKPSVLLLPGSMMEARKSVSLVYKQSSDISQ